jgi:hypothetical protein
MPKARVDSRGIRKGAKGVGEGAQGGLKGRGEGGRGRGRIEGLQVVLQEALQEK